MNVPCTPFFSLAGLPYAVLGLSGRRETAKFLFLSFLLLVRRRERRGGELDGKGVDDYGEFMDRLSSEEED